MPGRARPGSSAAPCGAERPGRAERPTDIFFSFAHACFYFYFYVFGIELFLRDPDKDNAMVINPVKDPDGYLIAYAP